MEKEAWSGVTRLEKLLFILQKETDFEGMESLYSFTAHNFGPFSKEVYGAIDFLESCELVCVGERAYSSHYANVGESELLREISDEQEYEPMNEDVGATEKLFSLTKNGHIVAKKLEEIIKNRHPKDIEKLYGIVRRYGNMPLNQLIRYVYRRYPDMTVKSIHPEARKS